MALSSSGQVFQPEDVVVLGAAVDQSVERLSREGDVRFSRPGHAYYARELIARLVIHEARAGVRDPLRLAEAALDQMSVR